MDVMIAYINARSDYAARPTDTNLQRCVTTLAALEQSAAVKPTRIRWPTQAEVASYREAHCCSLQQAVKDLQRGAMINAAEQAKTFDDLREVVVALANRAL
jgi:methylaspartate ammonia-lyase